MNAGFWSVAVSRCRQLYVAALRCWLIHAASQPFTVTGQSAMIVAPHQDDELFGCGGLIALKRAKGTRVQVVFLTDGAAAVKPTPLPDERLLPEIRKQEALEALSILGVERQDVFFLDLADGMLGEMEMGRTALEQFTSLLMLHQPAEVFVPHRHDCHPDHEAAFRIITDAIRRADWNIDAVQYAIWLLWSAPVHFRLSPEDLAGAFRLDMRSAHAQKLLAIDSYVSQTETLPAGFVNQFSGQYEIFFRSKLS